MPAIGRETNPTIAPEDSGVNISITDGNCKQILDLLDVGGHSVFEEAAPRSSAVDEARMALATRDKIKDFEVVFDRNGVARFFDTRGKKPHEYELVFSVAGELEPAIFNVIS